MMLLWTILTIYDRPLLARERKYRNTLVQQIKVRQMQQIAGN